MKTKVATAVGTMLDRMVAKAEGLKVYLSKTGYLIHIDPEVHVGPMGRRYQPTVNWSQGGPILTRERISRTIDHSGLWIAYWTDGYTEGDEGKKWMQCDRSELVAGLRCYVSSKLGEEVDVPEELI